MGLSAKMRQQQGRGKCKGQAVLASQSANPNYHHKTPYHPPPTHLSTARRMGKQNM